MKAIDLRISETVEELNHLYGRGQFQSVNFKRDGKHMFTRRIPITQKTSREEIKPFRCIERADGKTIVVALGHRRVIA